MDPTIRVLRTARRASQTTLVAFRDTLLNKGPGNPGVKAAFERVSQRYQALRETVDRSDSHEAHREMREVTDAYVDVQHEMGG